jgi:hypothetical protein
VWVRTSFRSDIILLILLLLPSLAVVGFFGFGLHDGVLGDARLEQGLAVLQEHVSRLEGEVPVFLGPKQTQPTRKTSKGGRKGGKMDAKGERESAAAAARC